ncbi:MAG: M48 family metalloprotease [Phycisphaerae bacterium]|nr:M48 family metalloprotease [Gemmatimonadaceae bacterium]
MNDSLYANRLCRLGHRFALTAGAVVLVTGSLTGCLASTQREVQMGADYAAQINRQLPLVEDPEVNRYINLIGDSIARVADDRSLQWHFYVVNQDEINAFAVPGGYIYINRGLVERAQNMSQLAGVLGHEIGHVVKRHSMKQMQKAEQANVGTAAICIFAPSVCNSQVGSAAIQLGGAGVFAKFSRDDEAQADEVGVQYTTRAGINPNGVPGMFNILLAERKTNPGAVEVLFASHPLEESRVAATQAQIAKINPAIIQSTTTDSPGFQSFKRRLASLPRVAKVGPPK